MKKQTALKIPVYNGPLTDGPLSLCALKWTLLLHFFLKFCSVSVLFSCCTFSVLRSFRVSMHFPRVALFSCYIFCMLHYFHAEFFVLHFFHVALSLYCTLFMLHCHTWIFLEQVLCSKFWSDCFFFMCCVKHAI